MDEDETPAATTRRRNRAADARHGFGSPDGMELKEFPVENPNPDRTNSQEREELSKQPFVRSSDQSEVNTLQALADMASPAPILTMSTMSETPTPPGLMEGGRRSPLDIAEQLVQRVTMSPARQTATNDSQHVHTPTASSPHSQFSGMFESPMTSFASINSSPQTLTTPTLPSLRPNSVVSPMRFQAIGMDAVTAMEKGGRNAVSFIVPKTDVTNISDSVATVDRDMYVSELDDSLSTTDTSVRERFSDQVRSLNKLLHSTGKRLGKLGETSMTPDLDHDDLTKEEEDLEEVRRQLQKELSMVDFSILEDSPMTIPSYRSNQSSSSGASRIHGNDRTPELQWSRLDEIIGGTPENIGNPLQRDPSASRQSQGLVVETPSTINSEWGSELVDPSNQSSPPSSLHLNIPMEKSDTNRKPPAKGPEDESSVALSSTGRQKPAGVKSLPPRVPKTNETFPRRLVLPPRDTTLVPETQEPRRDKGTEASTAETPSMPIRSPTYPTGKSSSILSDESPVLSESPPKEHDLSTLSSGSASVSRDDTSPRSFRAEDGIPAADRPPSVSASISEDSGRSDHVLPVDEAEDETAFAPYDDMEFSRLREIGIRGESRTPKVQNRRRIQIESDERSRVIASTSPRSEEVVGQQSLVSVTSIAGGDDKSTSRTLSRDAVGSLSNSSRDNIESLHEKDDLEAKDCYTLEAQQPVSTVVLAVGAHSTVILPSTEELSTQIEKESRETISDQLLHDSGSDEVIAIRPLHDSVPDEDIATPFVREGMGALGHSLTAQARGPSTQSTGEDDEVPFASNPSKGARLQTVDPFKDSSGIHRVDTPAGSTAVDNEKTTSSALTQDAVGSLSKFSPALNAFPGDEDDLDAIIFSTTEAQQTLSHEDPAARERSVVNPQLKEILTAENELRSQEHTPIRLLHSATANENIAAPSFREDIGTLRHSLAAKADDSSTASKKEDDQSPLRPRLSEYPGLTTIHPLVDSSSRHRLEADPPELSMTDDDDETTREAAVGLSSKSSDTLNEFPDDEDDFAAIDFSAADLQQTDSHQVSVSSSNSGMTPTSKMRLIAQNDLRSPGDPPDQRFVSFGSAEKTLSPVHRESDDNEWHLEFADSPIKLFSDESHVGAGLSILVPSEISASDDESDLELQLEQRTDDSKNAKKQALLNRGCFIPWLFIGAALAIVLFRLGVVGSDPSVISPPLSILSNAPSMSSIVVPVPSTPVPSMESSVPPTSIPSFEPSVVPTPIPSSGPTVPPTPIPTYKPTIPPTPVPTLKPTIPPTPIPTSEDFKPTTIFTLSFESIYTISIQDGLTEDIPQLEYENDLVTSMDRLLKRVLMKLPSQDRHRPPRRRLAISILPSQINRFQTIDCPNLDFQNRCEKVFAYITLLNAVDSWLDFKMLLDLAIASGHLQFELDQVNPQSRVSIIDSVDDIQVPSPEPTFGVDPSISPVSHMPSISLSPVTIRPSTSPSSPSTSSSSPNGIQPTNSAVLDLLTTKSFDMGEALRIPGTAQNKAYLWLLGNEFLDRYSDRRLLQRYVLATFFYSTLGEDWTSQTDWLGDRDECSWYSRSSRSPCDSFDTFQNLEMDYNNLKGELPPELGLLSDSLERIILRGGPSSHIAGRLPSELGYLKKISHFYIPGNHISGSLPSELGEWSSLKQMDISDNRFTGTLPRSLFANAVALEIMDIGNNRFSGALPKEVGSMQSCQRFNMADNLLSGAIPTEIGNLWRLQSFHGGSNMLSVLPSEIGHLAFLDTLSLEQNSLTGTIPSQLSRLQRLFILDLSSNSLSGPIPTGSFESVCFVHFVPSSLSHLHLFFFQNLEICSRCGK